MSSVRLQSDGVVDSASGFEGRITFNDNSVALALLSNTSVIRYPKDITSLLDKDMFYCIMPHETEKDYYDQVEQLGSLSKNLMQTGKPVLWTMAGNLDKLPQTYNSRFFREIRCLALVCDSKLLRNRMREDRGIQDENWIQSSIDYNEYFKTHNTLGETAFETFDISGKTVAETADYVVEWVSEAL